MRSDIEQIFKNLQDVHILDTNSLVYEFETLALLCCMGDLNSVIFGGLVTLAFSFILKFYSPFYQV